VSKCDFASYTFALRALEAVAKPQKGSVELLFTYDEEFGGELGPALLLNNGTIKPDLMVAAGFSYQVITAHNGCLQLEVNVHGKMAHAAIPESGVDALQAAQCAEMPLGGGDAGKSPLIRRWTDPKLTLAQVLAPMFRTGSAVYGLRLEGLAVIDCDEDSADLVAARGAGVSRQ
jgi:acetylornithine deacetylase/succinyl-diaminopimelate desuccinylase-like protein